MLPAPLVLLPACEHFLLAPFLPSVAGLFTIYCKFRSKIKETVPGREWKKYFFYSLVESSSARLEMAGDCYSHPLDIQEPQPGCEVCYVLTLVLLNFDFSPSLVHQNRTFKMLYFFVCFLYYNPSLFYTKKTEKEVGDREVNQFTQCTCTPPHKDKTKQN